MRRILGIVLAFVALGCAAKVDAALERYRGAFAIPNDTSRVRATLAVDRTGPLAARLDLLEIADDRPVRAYDVDMTKRLHLIVISDDFRYFAHVHPTLEPDGHFTIALHVPHPGRFYVYADAEPAAFGHTVFRFAVPFGDGEPHGIAPRATGPTARSGPYAVAVDATAIAANRPSHIAIAIAKNGRPAGDLTPYLGGAAHAVFVDTTTLAYVHVHPTAGGSPPAAMSAPAMEMATMPAGARVAPNLTLTVPALAPGRYALWLQFRGGGALHVARFTIAAR